METREQCMYIYMFFLHVVFFFIYLFLSPFIYLFIYFIFSIYAYISTYKSMHIYLHINMRCNTGNGHFFSGCQTFLAAKPAQNGGKQKLFLLFFKTELH